MVVDRASPSNKCVAIKLYGTLSQTSFLKLLKTQTQKEHMHLNHLTAEHVGVNLKTEVYCKKKPQRKLVLKLTLHSFYLVSPKLLEL